jgi:hypothetical protein
MGRVFEKEMSAWRGKFSEGGSEDRWKLSEGINMYHAMPVNTG